MRRSRFNKEQFAMALRQAEAGIALADICRKRRQAAVRSAEKFESAGEDAAFDPVEPLWFDRALFTGQFRLDGFVKAERRCVEIYDKLMPVRDDVAGTGIAGGMSR